MKFKLIAASIVLAWSGASMADTQHLGTLDAEGSDFGQTFWRIFGVGSALGGFTDYYTFNLMGAATGAQGGTAVDLEWGSLDLRLDSVSLYRTGYAGERVTDGTPGVFSFSGLGAGSYTLEVSGELRSLGGPLGVAHYEGSIRSVASAAPEAGAFAMALAGLVGVGWVTRRRKQQA